MAIINDNGVNIQTLQEAVISNAESYSEITGDSDVAPSSASGELIAITSEMDVRNQQNIADAFTQNTITDATGQNLDNIAEIKNQTRKENKKSIVYIKFTGVDKTIVPEGTAFTSSFNQEEFLSEYEVAIARGVAYVSAASVNVGVLCPSETISLNTPIVDITTATNQTDAEIGFASESDTLLRTRLQFIGSPFTNNLKEGLILALTEVQNVAKVSILDNNTNGSIDGVPAHNFSPVILGGNDAEIAKIVFRYMGVGNPSFGDVSQLLVSDIDSSLIYSVAFNRPTELLTVVAVTLSTDATFNTSTGFDEVENNIIEYFNSLRIGEDLLIQKVQAICLITGVTSAAVLLDGGAVSLASSFKELFVTNNSSVTVS